jgi:hypothetical protein
MSARAFRKPAITVKWHACRFGPGQISEICPSTRARGEGAGNDVFLRGENAMQIKHVCQSCGEITAVHEHSSWQEVKDCLAGMPPLCVGCNNWPCPSVQKREEERR